MSTKQPSRPKILVVDDTSANLVAMRHLLSRVPADIVTADSGNAALAACLNFSFAVILLDVQMPGMDGFEVAEILSQDESTCEIPVIFVSAAFDDINRLKGYGAGAVDYIAKPVNETILLSKIQVFLDLYLSKSQLQKTLEEMFELNCKLREEVAERQRAEEQAKYEATHDHLTHIPNRALFMDRLSTALARANRSGIACVLLYIDIDGFKQVNDQHGHDCGDQLLQVIAQRLNENLRKADTVARIGGDEFAIIIEEQGDLTDGVLRTGQNLCALLREPYPLAGGVIANVGASIGAALYPASCTGATDEREALIRAADQAMYRAKRSGKNKVCIAQPDYSYLNP